MNNAFNKIVTLGYASFIYITTANWFDASAWSSCNDQFFETEESFALISNKAEQFQFTICFVDQSSKRTSE